jgi:UPF0176 protein
MPLIVAALYKFAALPDYADHKPALEAACKEAGVKGTILLASEGVNGTIAGTREGVDQALDHIRALPGCSDLEHKESTAETMPFLRMKVRLKKEIVTLGVEGIDPTSTVGTYVEPEDWNALISDPETVVIDTRNDYEVGIGSFEGAINPQTKAFRDFPEWFETFRKTNTKPKIAMFCTGGIRCEKSTAFLKSQGLDDVYHLKGGILKYLETVPEEDSIWQGECFVFDARVSVGQGLALGSYDQCFACRRPITEADKANPAYEKGISCPACINEYSEEAKARFAERQKQIRLARERGEEHIGEEAQSRGKS